MSMEERLASLRKAEALDVSRQAVSKWESGAAVPTIDNLRAISRLYAVTVDYLVTGESGPERPESPRDPGVPKGTGPKRMGAPALCLICLLAAAVAVLTAVVIWLSTPRKGPEAGEFGDLIYEKWSTARVEEFRME